MNITSDIEMRNAGKKLASQLRGGDCIELIGDVGAGKTTFMKGVAEGLQCTEELASPSFTIARHYTGERFTLTHFDFYRLADAGVMQYDLQEALADTKNITAVEWAETVDAVLPEHRIVVSIEYHEQEHMRTITITGARQGGAE